MPEKYPSLSDMGIKNPEQITRYSYQTINDVDFLRIVYKRKSGSFLPSSKKFRFARTSKMVVVDSGSNTTKNLNEISPFLSKAIEELELIVNLKHSNEEQKTIIMDEINRLEEENHSRIAYIKSLVDKLD